MYNPYFHRQGIRCPEKLETQGREAMEVDWQDGVRVQSMTPHHSLKQLCWPPAPHPWLSLCRKPGMERQSKQRCISHTPLMASGLLCPMVSLGSLCWHCSLKVKTTLHHNVQTQAKVSGWPLWGLGYRWATQAVASSKSSEKPGRSVHIHSTLDGNPWFYVQWIHTTELP